MIKLNLKKTLARIAEIIIFLGVLAIFFYSGYKIATHYGILNKKALATESCNDCNSCEGNSWLSDLCKRIQDWCRNSCSCQPTSTPPPSGPTPTSIQPTPTFIQQPTATPTPYSFSPTPTSPVQPTSTPNQPETTTTPLPTATLKPGIGGPSGGDGGGSGPASPPVCTDTRPPKPFLREAKVLGGGKVSLLWDLVEPVSHYTIAYGPSSGKYLYGVDNTGKTSSFIIGGLGSGNYCFVVRGVNNCMPGEFSNELCTGQSGKVLGAAVLGATGSFDSNLLNIIFIMGTLCSSIGIRLLFGSKRLV